MHWSGLFLGVIGMALSVLGIWINPPEFFHSYLAACVFWIDIPVGSLALLMIYYVTGGGWGDFSRPVLMATAALVLPMAILFIPLAFGLEYLYPWITPSAELAEHLGRQTAYLNVSFFLIRSTIIFLLWIGLAAALGGFRRPAAAASKEPRYYRWSIVGLILYTLTITVFAIDWIMSLEPRWHSTNIGFQAGVGALVGGLAFAILLNALLAQAGVIPVDEQTRSRFQDLGNLILAGIMLWAYLMFNQYLTIWYENLPHKIRCYLLRQEEAWPYIAVLLAVTHVGLPFFALLSRTVKRRLGWLASVAVLVLIGRLLAAYWLVMPMFSRHYPVFLWLDVATLLGVGGIWLAVLSWLLPRQLASAAPLQRTEQAEEVTQHG
jgi:hypothetical protein